MARQKTSTDTESGVRSKELGTWDRTQGDVPVTKHPESFASPIFVSSREGRQMRSKTDAPRWWQRKARTQVSCTPMLGCGMTPTDHKVGQQQFTEDIDAQSVTTDTTLTSRELLPPIEKSTLRPFEVELRKMSIPPRPGYDRLYSGDTEVAPMILIEIMHFNGKANCCPGRLCMAIVLVHRVIIGSWRQHLARNGSFAPVAGWNRSAVDCPNICQWFG